MSIFNYKLNLFLIGSLIDLRRAIAPNLEIIIKEKNYGISSKYKRSFFEHTKSCF